MLNKKSSYMMVALALTSATIVFSSCGGSDDTSSGQQAGSPTNTNTNKGGKGLTANNQNANTLTDDASVTGYEVPQLDSHYDYICHRLSNGDINYVMEYDPDLVHSRWVAYTYNTRNAMKNAPKRTDAWNPDPYYNNQRQYQLNIQTFPGYTRGHLVGSAERYYSTEANEQTFYMTNMSPQLYAFNGSYWGEIEDKARDLWGRGVIDQKSTFYGGTLYIVKGGTIDKEENMMGKISVKNTMGLTIRMAVPRYYFMACLFVSRLGEAKAIGFWMEHKDYQIDTKDTAAMQQLRRSAVRSIDDLEQLTGFDFFCNLTDVVEDAVEASYDIAQWPGL